MTHEYVIALGGVILGSAVRPATAIAWAADRVLAVGPDDVVRAISRGDSTFLDLRGAAVTALPSDVDAAEAQLRARIADGRPFDAIDALVAGGLLDGPRAMIEPGSPADLVVWSDDPTTLARPGADTLRPLAIVRDGAFTVGDIHTGPFPRMTTPGRGG